MIETTLDLNAQPMPRYRIECRCGLAIYANDEADMRANVAMHMLACARAVPRGIIVHTYEAFDSEDVSLTIGVTK